MLVFMDTESYEQIELQAEFVGDRAAFLQDGMNVVVESHEGKPIGIRLPDQVTLEVSETEAVVKGKPPPAPTSLPFAIMACGSWSRLY